VSPRVPKEESLGRVDLTHDDILTSSGKFKERPKKWPPEHGTVANAIEMARRLNRLGDYYERQLTVSSGYRPGAVNDQIPGAAKKSLHRTCAATDLVDPKGELAAFCLADLPMLAHLELWMEDPAFTKGWVHLQLYPPRSGNRVFKP
jgi:hypothetical protein